MPSFSCSNDFLEFMMCVIPSTWIYAISLLCKPVLIVSFFTADNSKPRQLEPKSIFPGFPSYIYSRENDLAHSLSIYCNFTLGNSNLPLTRSNFFFPSDHFSHNFTLDNSNHVISAWKVGEETVHWSPKHWIYFKTTKSILCLLTFCHSSSNSVFIPVYFVA